VTEPGDLLIGDAEELFEDAPCGYLATRLDGTIVKVNRTFEEWTGHERAALLQGRRFQDLLTAGGRIYHETHLSPLLHMQGSAREIALDIVRADGTRLPALVNSVVREDATGRNRVIRTTVFDATDRRRYEQELVRAREREHQVALELQRSLLSGERPESERARTEVLYRPAVRTLEVGGDWHDAFWLDAPARIGLVLGDVVGRGIEAAATMGQLRSAVRAFASTGLGPAALLEALDGFVRRHGVGQMATVAYAEVDLDARRLRYACAGHPPPAVAEPGLAPRLLWDGRSLPLDAFLTVHPRPEASADITPGATVLLYSDGLVERRDRPIDGGFDALLAALGRHASDPSSAVAEPVADDVLGDAGGVDDVCVLALRLAAG
jgi:PAS domain S-box-containing protein